MQINRNGILVDVASQKRTTKIISKKQIEFHRYVRFATMAGRENGLNVIAVVPCGHPDFKKLQKQGYKIVETWEKDEIA